MNRFVYSSAATLLAVVGLTAQPAPSTSPASANGKAPATVKMISASTVTVPRTGGAGIVAVLENGVYRDATPEEMQALRGSEEMSARVVNSATILVTPDGRLHGALVPDSLFSGTVAVMGADGKIQTRCVTGRKAQEAALRQGAKRRTLGVTNEK